MTHTITFVPLCNTCKSTVHLREISLEK